MGPSILGLNDPAAARLVRDAPFRIDAASGLLGAAIGDNKGLADLTANYDKRKEAIQKLRGKWKDAGPDIAGLAALVKQEVLNHSLTPLVKPLFGLHPGPKSAR